MKRTIKTNTPYQLPLEQLSTFLKYGWRFTNCWFAADKPTSATLTYDPARATSRVFMDQGEITARVTFVVERDFPENREPKYHARTYVANFGVYQAGVGVSALHNITPRQAGDWPSEDGADEAMVRDAIHESMGRWAMGWDENTLRRIQRALAKDKLDATLAITDLHAKEDAILKSIAWEAQRRTRDEVMERGLIRLLKEKEAGQ